MNKKYSIYVMLIACLFSCRKKDIELYNSPDHVQFSSGYIDTVALSFFFYPNQDKVRIKLPVKLTGNVPVQDLHYKIDIDQAGTTALPEHYMLPSDFVFRKGRVTDTAYIDVNRRPDLLSKVFNLAIIMVPGGDLLPGQTSYIKRVFKISDMVSKPDWWNADCERIYLGKYTEKKFRSFMDVNGVGDISSYTSFEQRDFMLKLKYYLIEMKDAGTPVLEDDGTDMLSTIPLIG